MSKFDTIEYLKSGNHKQKCVYRILTENRILETLAEFSPILAGTIPIEIDIDESDLDIICYWTNVNKFKKAISTFRNNNDFKIIEKEIMGFETIIARFRIENFDLEIFGQNRPSKEQEAYKHMIIENQIIQKKGEQFRLDIIELKNKGLKTEPAFGLMLGLTHNPYIELLNLDTSKL